MSDRKDVLARLRKLRDRRDGRGLTEAEALATAEKVAQLMAEHGVSDDDLDMIELRTSSRSHGGSVRDNLWATTGFCTNTSIIFRVDREGRHIAWIGRAPGPEIAIYLHAVLDGAINRELAAFRRGEFYRRRRSAKTKRLAAEEFTAGLVARLRSRLLAMFRETRSEEAFAAAEAARDRKFPMARTVKTKKGSDRFPEARGSGWSAGGGVGLHHGVGGDVGGADALVAPQLRLGGPSR